MSSSSLLGIGVSGLNASQQALTTAGHNVANAGTPGFSRQRVELAALASTFGSGGILGGGVSAVNVARSTDQLVTNQIRTDTSAALDAKAFLDGAGQLDNVLANDSTGLAPGLDALFGAIAAASADPTSIPARRLVLTQAQGLSTRFHALYDRLDEQSTTVAGQLGVSAAHVTSLAQGIAQVNAAILRASGSGPTQLPNDLLDKRDELLRQLAEEVHTNVVTQSDGQLNVFIGNGVGLVVGAEARTLEVAGGGEALVLHGGSREQRLDDSVGGGRIGGLLRVRNTVLNNALNSLGRIGQVVAQTINTQLKQGIDLAGNAGGPLFSDINTVNAGSARVTREIGNGNVDLSVQIDDATLIAASDYTLSFIGPSNSDYQIKRRSDAAIVAQGTVTGAFPQTITFDHLRLTIGAGTFAAGDRFQLRPTRFGARDLSTVLNAPEGIALASPLRTTAAYGNRGTGHVDGADVLDISRPAFAVPHALSPPLIVRFTSATTYDVLDATDPLQPKPLDPPLTGLPFIAGVVNRLLPDDPGQRIALSDGALAGTFASNAVTVSSAQLAAGNTPGNGYLAEVLTLRSTDPTTQLVTTTVVNSPAGSSAAAVANSINAARGVNARASSSVTFTGLQASAATTVLIDGQSFSGAALANLGTLADSINARAALHDIGVTAKSDGTKLILTDVHGADLRVLIKGAASDALQLQGAVSSALTLLGSGPGTLASVVGNVDRSAGFDFSSGGPYAFSLAIDGAPAVSLALTGTYGNGAQLVQALQTQIDTSAIGAGHVTVAINGAGQLSLTTTRAGDSGSVTISNAAVGSPIALALGIANVSATGSDQYQATTVGGSVAVALASGVGLTALEAAPGGSLFSGVPTARSSFLGYQVRLSGAPVAGDQLQVTFNANGASDNRNAVALAALQTQSLIGGRQSTYADGYAEVVQLVGSKTSAARVEADAADNLVQQSTALRDSLAGVNLDEEAANLLRFQQAYTASARVVSTARELFNSLLSIFN